MELSRIVDWLDRELAVAAFSDVANNGVQLENDGGEIRKVAFAVDASLAAVQAAAEAGAQLLVAHHGISWGGGIARLTGGVGAVVRAAVQSDLALYGVHLPLDANEKYGNNFELARFLGLKRLKQAFVYHGETIGVIGTGRRGEVAKKLAELGATLPANLPAQLRVGICSGGAGAFAEEARKLGCDVYLTGEADWGEVIAAENCAMPMITAGHYRTETFGVKALARAMAKDLEVQTIFIER